MQSKELGRTGRTVSIVGIGTAFLGRARNQPSHLSAGEFAIDPGLGVSALVEALNSGVTLVDTAPFYGSESMVGEAISHSTVGRDRITVMTKAGRPGVGEFDFSRDAVMRHVDASLDRLKLDSLDVVSIHDAVHEDVSYIMSDRGAFGALTRLRDQGVIRAVGTACYDPTLNAQYIETGEFDVAICSASWSMLNLALRDRVLPAAQRHNVGLVIAEPLERGLLAVGVVPGRTYADRTFSADVLHHVGQIERLCQRYGYPILAVGLQWLVREPQVAASIPGAATPEEARTNALVGSASISDEFWSDLEPLIIPWSHAALGIEIK